MMDVDEEWSKPENRKKGGGLFEALSKKNRILFEAERLAERGSLVDLERFYRYLLSNMQDLFDITDLIRIRANLATIGVIYLDASTQNLSDYKTGERNIYSITWFANGIEWTVPIDVEQLIMKIGIHFNQLFELCDELAFELPEETIHAFERYMILKKTIAVNPICIFPMNKQLMGFSEYKSTDRIDQFNHEEIMSSFKAYLEQF